MKKKTRERKCFVLFKWGGGGCKGQGIFTSFTFKTAFLSFRWEIFQAL